MSTVTVPLDLLQDALASADAAVEAADEDVDEMADEPGYYEDSDVAEAREWLAQARRTAKALREIVEPLIDQTSSASRQHFIDTGHYLPREK